jgi:nucleoid-associated protein YgaU
MAGLRWRYWADQLLSKKSLATAGAAAVGLVGWATTHHPAFGWLMLGGGGAWTALMYYLGATGKGDAAGTPARAGVVREVERALKPFPLPRDEGTRARWLERARQLRRIVDLEKLILTDLPSTPSGVSLLSPEQELEVSEFVDQAIELARRRVLLLRAIQANPPAQLQAELRDLIARRQVARERVAGELDELIALKREQAARIERWYDDLHLTEINLDQIETFLRAVAYDQAVTPTNVSERINRLKSRVQARKESVEELERRINEAVS